jgi:hypothetical protein
VRVRSPRTRQAGGQAGRSSWKGGAWLCRHMRVHHVRPRCKEQEAPPLRPEAYPVLLHFSARVARCCAPRKPGGWISTDAFVETASFCDLDWQLRDVVARRLLRRFLCRSVGRASRLLHRSQPQGYCPHSTLGVRRGRVWRRAAAAVAAWLCGGRAAAHDGLYEVAAHLTAAARTMTPVNAAAALHDTLQCNRRETPCRILHCNGHLALLFHCCNELLRRESRCTRVTHTHAHTGSTVGLFLFVCSFVCLFAVLFVCLQPFVDGPLCAKPEPRPLRQGPAAAAGGRFPT